MAFKFPALQGYYAYITAFFLGCISVPGFAPFNLFPLTIASMAGLAVLWHNRSLRHTLLTAWWYGFGLYSAGASWVYVSIHEYGETPALLAIFMTGLFTAFLAFFFVIPAGIYHRLKFHRFYLLGFPALWVLSEWLRTWLLTGFPWLFSGYAFIDTPLSGFAPVMGVMGVSFISCLIACCFVAIIKPLLNDTETPKTKTSNPTLDASRYGGVILLLVLSGWGLQQVEWTTLSKSKPISVSLVQGNIPQETKWSPEMKEYTLKIYPELSSSSWGRDLLIWPEATIPAFRHEVLEFLETLNTSGKKSKTTFITGLPIAETVLNQSRKSEKAYYNSILAMGNGEGVYHKQKLVPFGEYVPMENWLRGLIPFFNLPMSGFNRGVSDQALLSAGEIKIAPFVCYEIVYPDLVAKSGKDADLLLTLSNDAWFGESIGPLQHFQMARMRALELGKYLLRGTNNGVTGIIDHKGKVIALAPQFKALVLQGEARLTEGSTPFSHYGSRPILFLAVLIIVSGIIFYRSRQNSGLD